MNPASQISEARIDRGVITQNPLEFSIIITDVETKSRHGTGIVLSADGQIVTCAHVVEAVLGVHPRKADSDARVGVHFPQKAVSGKREYVAKIVAYFEQYDDDVVLLQLVDEVAPINVFPQLSAAENSFTNPFVSYGYVNRPPYSDGYVEGTILGEVTTPTGKNLQYSPIELRTRDIRRGVSGAAVLDTKRNQVVGLITERWNPAGLSEDDNIGWATNARVLSLEQLGFELQDEPYPKTEATQPRVDDLETTKQQAIADPGVDLSRAPAVLPEWVGRDELLEAITDDYVSSERLVTGLIGFGGEGKSSLARKWVELIIERQGAKATLSENDGASDDQKPDGVFWWSFYEKPSSDEFFEAALTYIGGEQVAKNAQSANVRANIIGAMLSAKRYVVVLDGFEVMQEVKGDRYGLLKSDDMRQFLELFAAPGHRSFCLVTSRAPLLDLMAYTTYTHRDVNRLSEGDGRALLKNALDKPDAPDNKLTQIVNEWDGHALTLGLIGTYVREAYGGDVSKYSPDLFDTLPEPDGKLTPEQVAELPEDQKRYYRVRRVLARYDDQLNDAERAFLKLFSVFRLPVKQNAFDRVFRKATDATALNAPLVDLNDSEFDNLRTRLEQRRMIRALESDGELTYTAHPLVRNHYTRLLIDGDDTTKQAHKDVADYYKDSAGGVPRFPTLNDLAPFIEVVHHACRAGAYDEAFDILYNQILQRNTKVLIHQLGAYETYETLMYEFFPNGDTSQEPQVSNPGDKRFILNEVGLCLMNLGRMGDAPPFYERAVAGVVADEDWDNASIGYQNLADLYAHLGEVAKSADAAQQALNMARNIGNERQRKNETKDTLGSGLAWAEHLRGDSEAAGVHFQDAEALEKELYRDQNIEYLYSNRGIMHADHLRRIGEADYARRVTVANLEILTRLNATFQISQCQRVLGDLDADASEHDTAQGHYDEALRIARSIQFRAVLIEALLARGRWWATRDDAPNPAAAFSDLNEALGYATDGGYRIYEADIRVGLAWAYYRQGDGVQSRREETLAKTMSVEIGYHWGQVDADAISGVL